MRFVHLFPLLLHRQRGDEDAQQKPGTELLVDEAGVLADPADAGLSGQSAFDQRASIYIAAGGACGAGEQG